jgi:hypothetical protein
MAEILKTTTDLMAAREAAAARRRSRSLQSAAVVAPPGRPPEVFSSRWNYRRAGKPVGVVIIEVPAGPCGGPTDDQRRRGRRGSTTEPCAR